ncbi:MAG: hypothetical protein ACYDBH_02680 [Acidobacteriaceae bacterium]
MSEIVHIHQCAMVSGAICAKIIGDSGGFQLIIAKLERQAAIRERLKNQIHAPFDVEDSGSRVVFCQPNGL